MVWLSRSRQLVVTAGPWDGDARRLLPIERRQRRQRRDMGDDFGRIRRGGGAAEVGEGGSSGGDAPASSRCGGATGASMCRTEEREREVRRGRERTMGERDRAVETFLARLWCPKASGEARLEEVRS